MKNIFEEIPGQIPEEIFETIVQASNIKIERIISKGHTTPSKSWYNQNFDEWVLIIQGAAKINFDNHSQPISLTKGSYLWIPAKQKHQVIWTPKDVTTIWLAIHIFKESRTFSH